MCVSAFLFACYGQLVQVPLEAFSGTAVGRNKGRGMPVVRGAMDFLRIIASAPDHYGTDRSTAARSGTRGQGGPIVLCWALPKRDMCQGRS